MAFPCGPPYSTMQTAMCLVTECIRIWLSVWAAPFDKCAPRAMRRMTDCVRTWLSRVGRRSIRRVHFPCARSIRHMHFPCARRYSCWVLGSHSTLRRSPHWAAFVDSARARGCVRDARTLFQAHPPATVRAPAADTRRGPEDTRRGPEDTRRGPEDTRRGQEDTRRGQEDTRRLEELEEGELPFM